MEDVSKNEGRTVLFVSHQMDAIEMLTQKCIYLQNGKMLLFDHTKSTIDSYTKTSVSDFDITKETDRSGTGKARIISLDVYNKNRERVTTIRQGQVFEVVVGVECKSELVFDISFVLEDYKGGAIFCTHFSDSLEPISKLGNAEFQFLVDVPYLRQGEYNFSMALFRPDKTEFYDVLLHKRIITVDGIDDQGMFPTDNRWGNLFFPIKWRVN